MQTTIPWAKIKALEDEIKALKALGKKTKAKKKVRQKKDPLKGILKGIHFSEKEIDESQKAIFNFKEVK